LSELADLINYQQKCITCAIFRTSLWEGGEGRVWRRELGHLSRKHIFVRNANSGCTLTQFLTGRRLGTWILRFNREKKVTKTAKNYAKIHGKTK